MRPFALSIVLFLVLAALGVRAIARRRIERRWREAHAVGASGVLVGAESIDWTGGARAALLLHGFGSSPHSLRGIAEALRDRGWTVRAPLLPGHGRSLEAFSRSRRAQWLSCVDEAYDDLAAGHSEIAIVGASMGGALAVLLAARRSPRALVLLTPYLALPPNGKLLTSIWPLWQLVRPYVASNEAASIHDPVARAESLGHGRAAPRTLLELRHVVEAARARLATIRTPTLAIFSSNDYRIARRGAEESFQHLGAQEKMIRWVERSGHVISVDHDRETVIAETVEWLEHHVPGEQRTGDGRQETRDGRRETGDGRAR